VVHSFVLTLRSAGGYADLQNSAALEGTFAGMGGTHLVLPQLIGQDGILSSAIDLPVILRYARVSGDVVDDVARVIHSGLVGPELLLGTTLLSQTFAGKCPGTPDSAGNYPTPCFLGDYRYGAFFERAADGRRRFFTPWTGQVAGLVEPRALGSIVNVAP
jgi:hypothetical protein